MSWTQRDRDKAAAVVLNKVDGLWFAYYAVDLSAEAPPFTDADARAMLDAIETRDERFRWTGTDEQRALLLPLLQRVFRDHPELAMETFRRIFDMNEIPPESGGTVTKLNEGERRARLDAYLRAVKKGRCATRKILVAEGDSWFQFPGSWFWVLGARAIHIDFVDDILDHLIARPKYCIRSLAAGGDWLFKMLRAQDYVEPLSQIEPDAFLLSGGGNDLLGDGRVANMTLNQRRHDEEEEKRKKGIRTPHEEILAARLAAVADRRDVVFDPTAYTTGVFYLAKEFVSFMNLLLVQYAIFFSDLRHSKLENMAILTHGYDFAIPTPRTTASFIWPRHWVNKLLGSGKWLWMPLEQKRLGPEQKRAVVYAMITEFNELLVSLANSPRFPHLYHVDCRGVAQSQKDWYDEIHLTSKAFKRAAGLFEVCLDRVLVTAAPTAKKVFTVSDLP